MSDNLYSGVNQVQTLVRRGHAAAAGGGYGGAGGGEGGGGEELPLRAVCPPAPVPRGHGQGQRDTAQHTGGYIDI